MVYTIREHAWCRNYSDDNLPYLGRQGPSLLDSGLDALTFQYWDSGKLTGFHLPAMAPILGPPFEGPSFEGTYLPQNRVHLPHLEGEC